MSKTSSTSIELALAIDTTRPGYHQEALIPLEASTHAGEDVPLYAQGPGAQRFHGVLEQNTIYHLMRAALGLDQRKLLR